MMEREPISVPDGEGLELRQQRPTRQELYELIKSPHEPEPFDPSIPPDDVEEHLARKMPGVGEIAWVGDGYAGTYKSLMRALGFKKIGHVSDYVKEHGIEPYDEFKIGRQWYRTYHTRDLGPLIERRNGQLKERPRGMAVLEETIWIRDGQQVKIRVGSTQSWQDESNSSGLWKLLQRRGIKPEAFTYGGVPIHYFTNLDLDPILAERLLKLCEFAREPRSGEWVASYRGWAKGLEEGPFRLYPETFLGTLEEIEAHSTYSLDDGAGETTDGYSIDSALAAVAHIRYKTAASASVVPGMHSPLARIKIWAAFLHLVETTIIRRLRKAGIKKADKILPSVNKGTLHLYKAENVLRECEDLLNHEMLNQSTHWMQTLRKESDLLHSLGVIELDRAGRAEVAGRTLETSAALIKRAVEIDDEQHRQTILNTVGGLESALRAFTKMAGHWSKPVLLSLYDVNESRAQIKNAVISRQLADMSLQSSYPKKHDRQRILTVQEQVSELSRPMDEVQGPYGYPVMQSNGRAEALDGEVLGTVVYWTKTHQPLKPWHFKAIRAHYSPEKVWNPRQNCLMDVYRESWVQECLDALREIRIRRGLNNACSEYSSGVY